MSVTDWLGALLAPQRVGCHLCGARPLSGGVLCGKCQRALNSLRLERRPSPEAVAAASAYAYRGEARALVRALKYGADFAAAEPLADGMSEAFALEASLRGCEALVYVPASPSRERERGYNQAKALCERFAKRVALPIVDGALVRDDASESQVEMTRAERFANVRGAFRVGDASRIAGKRVLLIDDVLTTGATALACTEALLGGGAASVRALTACRA